MNINLIKSMGPIIDRALPVHGWRWRYEVAIPAYDEVFQDIVNYLNIRAQSGICTNCTFII